MRKFVNFKKRPVSKGTAEAPLIKGEAKKKAVQSMLLRTYFTSLLCLVLCVTMFFGTSYAWFTSEVNNAENEIYVGMLKVGLYKEQKNAKTKEIDQLDLADSEKKHKLFDKSIRWEPGYTSLETIQVVNLGDLAFKYVLTFTDGTLVDSNAQDKDAALAGIAQHFDVWVFDHYANKNQASAISNPTSYSEISKDTGWEPAGSLAEVLAGKTVLDGKMVTVRKDNQDPKAINAGTTDGVDTTDRYTIALHMKETASSEVMGQKIKLNVKLVAYQMATEDDDFGNDNYDDELVTAANAKELKTALESENSVVLASDIVLGKADERVTMKTPLFDGNGKKITYAGERVKNSSVGVVTTSGGKIANLTIDGGENGRALYVTKLTSDLVVSNCNFSGAYAFNLNSAAKNDKAILSFIDTTFASWTSYANVANHAYFTGCTFKDVLKPYGDTTLTNCTFDTHGLDVSALEAKETITLINCTYNGKLIEKATVTFDGTTLTLSGSSAIKLNADKLVVLNDNV